MAKAYMRPDSQYIWVTFSINKKRYRQKTKYEANEKNLVFVQKEVLPVLMHEIKKGSVILEKSVKKNFKYYSDLFLKTKRDLKPNSYRQYESQIIFWNKYFCDREINDIKASEIKEIIFNLTVKPQTQRDMLARLKSIFEEAELDEAITSNPAKKVKIPRAAKRKILPLAKDEVTEILNNATDFFKCYLAIGFYTGMRTGEILALKWQNVNLDKKLIFVDVTVGTYEEQDTKTNESTRYVPIFEPLIPYLREQQQRNGLSKYVFSTKTGRHYSSTNLIKHFWKPLLRRLHIPYRRLYETRHTFATNMIASNKFSLNQIASWLGHSNIQTLISKYNNYIPSEIAKFDSKFNVFDTENDTQQNQDPTKFDFIALKSATI
ncbi:site-specific integrase [Aliarcobacter butzleri]|uniref:tyrosine-type recombinase/integrase n=1 Tax=Aliarcobacter butzleri TaxID=28197 RepID=UPI00263DB363|nr:site-specific integrase [Aliarcobacter butzleri]MDN5062268.1 site-specific integrase [Aliarcobacter butzleri]